MSQQGTVVDVFLPLDAPAESLERIGARALGWALDQVGTTKEDASRTRLYRENADRERYREQSFSLSEFVRGLDLRVEFGVPTETEISRVSQLTLEQQVCVALENIEHVLLVVLAAQAQQHAGFHSRDHELMQRAIACQHLDSVWTILAEHAAP